MDHKYEEALERAKELHEAGNALTKSQMEIVFPELKESEDERIRKSIVTIVNQYARMCEKEGDPCEASLINDALAYLERKKDLATIPDSIKTSHIETLKNLLSYFKWERKSTREEINTSFIPCLEYLLKDAENSNDRVEWSEEDEKILKDCIDMPYSADFISRERKKDAIRWLKSLRPQPHWKPSENQMRCLLDCVSKAKEIHNASVGGYDAYRILMSLYDDLKKLL